MILKSYRRCDLFVLVLTSFSFYLSSHSCLLLPPQYLTIVKVVNEMIIPRVEISSADEQTSSKKKDQPPNMIPPSSFLSERDPTASDMLLEYSVAKVKNYGMVNGKDVSFEVVIEVRREIEND